MRDPLSRTFAALADPTRRAMLASFSAGAPSSPPPPAPFLNAIPLPAVTKHPKVLENAGLITKGRKAQWRPCQLNGEPLREAVDWMEQHRIAGEAQLDRLGAYLKAKTKGSRHGRK